MHYVKHKNLSIHGYTMIALLVCKHPHVLNNYDKKRGEINI